MAHLGTQPHVGTIARAHEVLQKAPPPPKKAENDYKEAMHEPWGISSHGDVLGTLGLTRGS